jgi:hypothetical protein
VITTGTAAGPGVGNNQIILDVNASTVDGAYDPAVVAIVNGTGSGQSRLILEYKGSTKAATVDRNWKVLPDDTSEYSIFADSGREHVNEGLAQGGTSTTITLNALASSFDDAYVRQSVFIRSGTGEDQVRTVISYNGTTKIATVDESWDVTPDTTSGYVMRPTREHTKESLYDMHWRTVYIDTEDGVPGTDAPGGIPIGTAGNPSNNITDAKTIADAKSIKEFSLKGSIILNTTFDDYSFSNHCADSTIDLNNQSVVNAVFEELTLTGVQNGRICANRCKIDSLTSMEGEYTDCVIDSNLNCKTGVWTHIWGGQATGATIYTIDMNSGARVGITKTTLACKVQNMTDPAAIMLKHGQGVLVADNTNTEGTIRIGGEAAWVDNGVGGNVVVTDDTTRAVVWDETLAKHLTAGTTGKKLYDGGTGDPAEIAAAVWDADKNDYNDPDTMGELQNTGGSGGGGDPEAIADAIWDEASDEHTESGTMGELQNVLKNATVSKPKIVPGD